MEYFDTGLEERFEARKSRNERRKVVLWSASSIAGYAWDVVRNLIVVAIILSIYSSTFDNSLIILVSIGIVIYITTVSSNAQLAQELIRTNLRLRLYSDEILKKLGHEQDEDSKMDFEQAGFLLEKTEYKFLLNAVFMFVILSIALLNLIAAIS